MKDITDFRVGNILSLRAYRIVFLAVLLVHVRAFDPLGGSVRLPKTPNISRGLPLVASEDGGSLFQAGGLPIPVDQACMDTRLASRTVTIGNGGTTSSLSRFCQDAGIGPHGNGSYVQSRIVGGVRSNGSRYPYLALVFDDQYPFCQGFLVKPRWILTAAHCVDDAIIGVKIGSDRWIIDDILGHKYVTSRISKHIMHEDYVLNYLRPGRKNIAPPSDIALIQLVDPITSVTPVKLATKYQSTKLPKIFTVIGFGRTSEFEAGMSNVLREVQVNKVDRKKCQNAFNKELKKSGYWSKGAPTYIIGKGIICAGDNKKKKQDACQGDSGGPLIAKGKTSEDDVVYGITSFGEGCGRKGLSGGYTNVGYFEKWIAETIRKHGG